MANRVQAVLNRPVAATTLQKQVPRAEAARGAGGRGLARRIGRVLAVPGYVFSPAVRSSVAALVVVALSAALPCLAVRAQSGEAKGPAGPPPGRASARPLLKFKYRHEASSIAFSPDSHILASSSFRRIRLTDMETGKLARTGEVQHGTPNSMAFSPDGKFLVAGTNAGKVEVLRTPTLVQDQVLPVTKWSIYALAVSPDSSTLASCAADGTVELWEIKSARRLRALGAKGERMASIAFSPDGKLVAALSRYGRCDVWNAETGKRETTADGVGNEGSDLLFSRDGGTLGIATGGQSIHVWNFRANKPSRVQVPDVLVGKPRVNGPWDGTQQDWRPMNAPLGEFSFGMARLAPGLRAAASVLENGSVAIWDVAGRRLLRILPTAHEPGVFGGGVRTLAISPNGALLAAGNMRGDVEVWRLQGESKRTRATPPIAADETPGPWGPALDGLRTRLILKPVKPSREALLQQGKGGREIDQRQIPVAEGVWWKVCLQVRNETKKELKIVWPEIRRAGAIVIARENGQRVPYHSIRGDPSVTRQIPITVLPGDVSTQNSILLGRNHDMRRPGKYRIQFPETKADGSVPPEVTNRTLPASNVLEFENAPPSVATPPAVKTTGRQAPEDPALGHVSAGGRPRWYQDLFAVDVNGKWGYIDDKGRIVIEPAYEVVHCFGEGLAAVRLNGKYGFIDKTGKVVIPPQFVQTFWFREGLAWVDDGANGGFIDKTGRIVLRAPPGTYCRDFRCGLAKTMPRPRRHAPDDWEGKVGFIDKTGKRAIAKEYDDGHGFHEGLAGVKINGKWGCIDKTGAIVIEPRFDEVSSFFNGRAGVVVHKKFGFIDKTGKMVVKPHYDYGHFFLGELANVWFTPEPSNGAGRGYVSRRGQVVWKPSRIVPHRRATPARSNPPHSSPRLREDRPRSSCQTSEVFKTSGVMPVRSKNA